MWHANTFMGWNTASMHLSLKMLIVLLPEKKHLYHPWEQEENLPQNLQFCQISGLDLLG